MRKSNVMQSIARVLSLFRGKARDRVNAKAYPPDEFKARMDDRLERWYRLPSGHPDPAQSARARTIANLVNKSAMFDYAQTMGLPLPHRYATFRSLEELDVDALPDRVVIKPDNQANNTGVMLFDGSREVFSGDIVPLHQRRLYVLGKLDRLFAANAVANIIAEEFIEDYDPGYTVPRDFKVFVAGGRPWVIQVVERDGPKSAWRHCFYTTDWESYGPFQLANALAPPIPKPPHFEDLLALSTRIAEDIQCFMRLDFYISTDRVIFGEFTSYPNAGTQFTPLGNDVLCGLMDRYPDPF